jgi:hypothetical protein
MNPDLDPTLMAYADGELSPADAAAFELRLASEPALQTALARQQTLKLQLRAGFDPVLDEPVPAHLLAMLQGTPGAGQDAAPVGPAAAAAAPPAAPTLAPVLNLARARAQRQAAARAEAPPVSASGAGLDWARWGGVAASLVLGLTLGHFVWPPAAGDAPLAQGGGGTLLATGPLAQALNTQLSGQSQQGVTPGLSFVAQGGAYCRSFSVAGDAAAAGLACREAAGWRVKALLPPSTAAASGEMRTAATALPPALLQLVDTLRAGDSLDAAAETAARERGWQR